MDSNYASLNSYYGKEKFEYSSTYNVAKFDIVKYANEAKFQAINVDPSISSMTIQPSFPDGQVIIKADRLPDNFEIRSFDVYNNEAGKWVHNTIPLSVLYKYITYDNKKKEIYIGAVPTVPGVQPVPTVPVVRPSLQSQVFALGARNSAPTVRLLNNKIEGNPFARIYITY